MAQKAFKFKLSPTSRQQQRLSQFCGCARFIYNWGLDRAIKQYEETKKPFSYNDLAKELTLLKQQDDTKWLNDCANVCLQQSLRNLDTAFRNFFRKRGQFPKFKSRKRSKNVCKFIENVQFDYKAEWYGKNVVFVGRFEPTSQMCSSCGSQNKAVKDLSVRQWTCPVCGAVHDRDVNAAKNIKDLGLRSLNTDKPIPSASGIMDVEGNDSSHPKNRQDSKSMLETQNVPTGILLP